MATRSFTQLFHAQQNLGVNSKTIDPSSDKTPPPLNSCLPPRGIVAATLPQNIS